MATVAELLAEVSGLDPSTPIIWFVKKKDGLDTTAAWSEAEWEAFVDHTENGPLWTIVDGLAVDGIADFRCNVLGK